jgi:hypothetical protein
MWCHILEVLIVIVGTNRSSDHTEFLFWPLELSINLALQFSPLYSRLLVVEDEF